MSIQQLVTPVRTGTETTPGQLGSDVILSTAKVKELVTASNAQESAVADLQTKALRDKGFYATSTALIAANPTGVAGDKAIVGATDTLWTWDVEGAAWKNTGASAGGITVDSAPTSGSANAVSSGGVYAALAGLSAAEMTRLTGLAMQKPVFLWGSRFPTEDSLSDVGKTQETSRLRFHATAAVSGLTLAYTNAGKPGSAVAGAAVTIKASIEYPLGTITPVYFRGQRTLLVPFGGSIEADVCDLEIPEEANIWVRFGVTVNTGERWIQQYGEEGTGNEGVVDGDAVDSGSITATGGYVHSVVGVLGYCASREVSTFKLGDSIATGQSDANYTSLTRKYELSANGLFGRAFGYHPSLTTNINGQQTSNLVPAQRAHFSRWLQYCGLFIDQLGINDLNAGPTYAAFTALKMTLWDSLLARGIRGYATTITPYAPTSTDAWATVSGQTTYAPTNVARVPYNNWLRDGAPLDVATRQPLAVGSATGTTIRAGHPGHPLLGFFEVADAVESARDSGKWKAGYTNDGLHPNPTGYAAAAPAIDVTKYLRW